MLQKNYLRWISESPLVIYPESIHSSLRIAISCLLNRCQIELHCAWEALCRHGGTHTLSSVERDQRLRMLCGIGAIIWEHIVVVTVAVLPDNERLWIFACANWFPAGKHE